MNTGGEYQQGGDHVFGHQYHIRYESYVGNNWVTGCNFAKYVTENTAVNSITDPSAAVKSQAKYSYPYYARLWQEITNNPNFDMGQDTAYIQYITIKTNQEAAKYNAGLAGYINRP